MEGGGRDRECGRNGLISLVDGKCCWRSERDDGREENETKRTLQLSELGLSIAVRTLGASGMETGSQASALNREFYVVVLMVYETVLHRHSHKRTSHITPSNAFDTERLSGAPAR